jgi:hypothetical protein
MKKIKYEPPVSIDCNSRIVIGQTSYSPNCECKSGCGIKPPEPECRSGMSPYLGSCQSGGFPSAYCNVGSAAGHHH